MPRRNKSKASQKQKTSQIVSNPLANLIKIEKDQIEFNRVDWARDNLGKIPTDDPGEFYVFWQVKNQNRWFAVKLVLDVCNGICIDFAENVPLYPIAKATTYQPFLDSYIDFKDLLDDIKIGLQKHFEKYGTDQSMLDQINDPNLKFTPPPEAGFFVNLRQLCGQTVRLGTGSNFQVSNKN